MGPSLEGAGAGEQVCPTLDTMAAAAPDLQLGKRTCKQQGLSFNTNACAWRVALLVD